MLAEAAFAQIVEFGVFFYSFQRESGTNSSRLVSYFRVLSSSLIRCFFLFQFTPTLFLFFVIYGEEFLL
ncbi:hypothetical protein BDZ94DRAFT_1270253, partial [Collybia nuda]